MISPSSDLPALVCKYPCWCRCHGKHRTASSISRFLPLAGTGIELQKKSLADSLHIKKGSSCPRVFLFCICQCAQYMSIWSCFHFLSITVSKDMVWMGWGTVANWLLFWSDTPLPDCQEHCWKISRLPSCLSSPPDASYKCKQNPIL